MAEPINLPQKGPDAIFLMGPTASGKTDLAMKLVEHLPVEVISVDSAMVYKGMNIGAAKPTEEELQRCPHRLIDIRDVTEPYSAANFREDALKEMWDITHSGKIPLLVGGTMLYFKALYQGLADLPSADEKTRRQLEEEVERLGLQGLHDELKQVDPTSAQRIHPNDPQRLLRALEVYRVTGKSLTALTQEQINKPFPFHVVNLAIAPLERSILHRRIEQRFDVMLEAGLVQEVESFWKRGDVHADLPAMKSVGYRQVWQYLDGELDVELMREKAVVASRQLAKRQLTWLRSWPKIHWLDSLSLHLASDTLNLLKSNLM